MRHIVKIVTTAIVIVLWTTMTTKAYEPVYDLDRAKELCRELPLEKVEGIWSYPDDKVVVLILRNEEDFQTGHASYTIQVVETSDARLRPGEKIGSLRATAKERVYQIDLATEKRNEILMKSKSCLATLSTDGEAFLIEKQKAPFKGRLNLNFSRLLPGFWKIVSLGVSQSSSGKSVETPVGMIKLFPGYDGNESTRRKVRYL